MKRKLFLVISFLILSIFLTGCSGSGIVTPVTSNQSPTASFTANPTSGVVPLEVSFNASNSSDSDGSIISYAWDFKDGNKDIGQTINHTFSSAGSYNVMLTVIDNEGATDSVTKVITVTDPIVSNQLPTASFTVNPASGVAPLEVYFNASGSYDSDGNIVSYAWDFKDGSTGNGETINHTFSSTGSYSVKLTVIDNEGATDSSTKTIAVTEIAIDPSNQSPTASFTSNPTSGLAPLVVYFNASGSYDSDGDIVSYQWDFKDGNMGSGQTVNHTFTSAGNYSVKLTVIDNEGATDSSTKTITVTETNFNNLDYLEGAIIIANDNEYLGKISKSQFDSDSINNQFGTYGSQFSAYSIFNNFGTYGSEFSSLSPFNKFTSTPPKIYKENVFIAYLSVNTFMFPRVDTNLLVVWLNE